MLYNLKEIVKTRSGAKTFQLIIKNLQIRNGAKVAITGPSGCGKSTTLDILGFSLAPDPGGEFAFQPPACSRKISILDLWRKKDFGDLASLRLAYLGYVLQTGELFPYLTVGENLQFTALLAGRDKKETHEIAVDLAKQLDIYENWDSSPGTLSIGERQRVAIGRALAARPKVILADEPTAALDPLHAQEVMRIFLAALEDFGSALALVTHNRKWALDAGLEEAPFHLEKSGEDATIAILDYAPDKEEE